MMQPEISVVIPLYNKEKHIARTIDSVLSQTLQNFELIIVNDGSTDNSAPVVNTYKDSRIHLINQPNQGVSAARNQGIRNARSNVIAFLDADDEWKPDFLEIILHMYQKYPLAGLYASAFELDYHTKRIVPKFAGLPLSTSGGIIEDYFKTTALSGRSPISSSSFAARKSILEQAGLFNPASHQAEDQELWGKIAFMGFPLVYSPNLSAVIHVIADNKATDKYYSLEHLPFVDYIYALPEDKVKSYEYYPGLMQYIELLELVTAYKSIGYGNMTGAKRNLSSVHSDIFTIQKYALLSLTYIPFNFGRIIPKIYLKIKKHTNIYH